MVYKRKSVMDELLTTTERKVLESKPLLHGGIQVLTEKETTSGRYARCLVLKNLRCAVP